MKNELKKLRKSFISEKPFKKTNEDILFEKSKELDKKVSILEKELMETKRKLDWANNFIRKFIPAFPSQINRNNLIYIKEKIEEELKNG